MKGAFERQSSTLTRWTNRIYTSTHDDSKPVRSYVFHVLFHLLLSSLSNVGRQQRAKIARTQTRKRRQSLNPLKRLSGSEASVSRPVSATVSDGTRIYDAWWQQHRSRGPSRAFSSPRGDQARQVVPFLPFPTGFARPFIISLDHNARRRNARLLSARIGEVMQGAPAAGCSHGLRHAITHQ